MLVKKRDGMECYMLREWVQETLVLVFCPLSDRDGSRANWFHLSLLVLSLSLTVERGDPGILSQHKDAARRMQVRP